MRTILGLVCAAVLAIILSLGLWPFHAPSNEVAWLGGRPGLAFGRFSSAIATAAFPVGGTARDLGASVEIWLQPARIWDQNTFLAFCDPGNPHKLALRQSQMDLEVRTAQDRNGIRRTGLFVPRVFPRNKPVFLTIASGTSGTAVYVDGGLVRTVAQLRLSSEDFTGRFVVGDSPGQTDSWQGRLFGLAVYYRELQPPEVRRHYLFWTQRGQPDIGRDECNVALYLLNEGQGTVVHNSAASGPDLNIPRRYTVVDQIFLEPFWREFGLTRSYGSAALKNVVGFVPLGCSFYACFLALRLKLAGLVAVLFGTGVSLSIEVLQFFLPTRDSGTTDIFTNTLGTWIGVAGYHVFGPMLARAVPATALRLPRSQRDPSLCLK